MDDLLWIKDGIADLMCRTVAHGILIVLLLDSLLSLHSGGANSDSSSPLADLLRVPSEIRSSQDHINYLLSSDSMEDSMEANGLVGMPEVLAGLRSSSVTLDVLQSGDDVEALSLDGRDKSNATILSSQLPNFLPGSGGDDVEALLSFDGRDESNATILSTQLPNLLPGSGNSSIASAMPHHYGDVNDMNNLLGLGIREASTASIVYFMPPNHPFVHTVNSSGDEEWLSTATYMSMRNESVSVDIEADSVCCIKSHLDGQTIVKGKRIIPDVKDSSPSGCGMSGVIFCHCNKCVSSDLDDDVGPTSQNVVGNHCYRENIGWYNDMVEHKSDGTEDDGDLDGGMGFADLFPPVEVNDKIHVVDNF